MSETRREAYFKAECSHEKLKDFCVKCGVILTESSISLKPERYEYFLEIYPTDILQKMKENCEIIIEGENSAAYLKERNYLIHMLRNLNNKLRFRSQTFFLAVCYMDLLFNKKITNKIDKFELLSICCLLIAAKFDENDPNIPDLYHFQAISSASHNKYKFFFTIEELKKNEVKCIKALGYKMSYFTPYHFIIYFFSHGIVFNHEFQENANKYKIIEKIYNFARDILDLIYEKGGKIIFHNNFHIASAIIYFARQSVLGGENEQLINNNSKSVNNFDPFESIYEIKFVEYEETYKLVKNIYEEYKKSQVKESKEMKLEQKIEEKLNSITNERVGLGKHNNEANFQNAPIPSIKIQNINSYKGQLNPMQDNKSTSKLYQKYKIPTKLEKLNKSDYNSDNMKPRAFSSQKELKKKQLINQDQFSSRILKEKATEIIEEAETDEIKYKDLEAEVIPNMKKNIPKSVTQKSNQEQDYKNNENLLTENNIDQDQELNILAVSNNKGRSTGDYKLKITNILDNTSHDVTPNEKVKTFDYKQIKRQPSNRIRVRNDSFPDFTRDISNEKSERDDLLNKTKRIFKNTNSNQVLYKDTKTKSNLVTSEEFYKEKDRKTNLLNYTNNIVLNNNPQSEKILNSVNPSTIIINNNININTYITKSYIPTQNKYRNGLNDLNYINSYHKNELLCSTHKKAKNEYQGITLEKENIRKKIDHEITIKNKATGGDVIDRYKDSSSRNFNYKEYIPVPKYNNTRYEYSNGSNNLGTSLGLGIANNTNTATNSKNPIDKNFDNLNLDKNTTSKISYTKYLNFKNNNGNNDSENAPTISSQDYYRKYNNFNSGDLYNKYEKYDYLKKKK